MGENRMEKHQIDALESRLKQLKSDLEDLGDGSDIDELLFRIHFPGWTTLPEHFLVTGITESLIQQVASVRQLKETLTDGSRVIIGDPEGVREAQKKVNQPSPAPHAPPSGSKTLGGGDGPSYHDQA
jgi:hypothetical protein